MLLKVNIQPPVTREECRKLWPQFRLNAKNTLDWHEFLRYFLYDQSTAAFPNAKHAPPRKGDDDFNKRSNRFNGVQYFLKDSVRQMIDWKFAEFQEQFLQLGKAKVINYLILTVFSKTPIELDSSQKKNFRKF